MVAELLQSRILVPIILAGVLAVLFGLERVFPLRRRTRPTGRRILTNVIISGLGMAAGGLAVRPAAIWLMGLGSANDLGLVRLVALPGWARAAAAFVLMDLTFYYWHRFNHEWGLLWRFHSVHHVDPDLDVTTSFRFHVGEILYSAVFRAVQVMLIGVSLPTFVVYELVFQCATLFHHSNLRIPVGLERLLNLVLVTPRMHGIHHSTVVEETNSNYSVIFRWWDALNRSLRLNIPQDKVTIGVAGYDGRKDNTVLDLLCQPLRRERKDRAGLKRRADAAGRRTAMAE